MREAEGKTRGKKMEARFVSLEKERLVMGERERQWERVARGASSRRERDMVQRVACILAHTLPPLLSVNVRVHVQHGIVHVCVYKVGPREPERRRMNIAVLSAAGATNPRVARAAWRRNAASSRISAYLLFSLQIRGKNDLSPRAGWIRPAPPNQPVHPGGGARR